MPILNRGLTAVSTISLSVSSILPPGSAVCPGCVRSVLARVVRSTLRVPSFSYKRTRTPARFERGTLDLYVYLSIRHSMGTSNHTDKSTSSGLWANNLPMHLREFGDKLSRYSEVFWRSAIGTWLLIESSVIGASCYKSH